jgi:membrane-associated phospholipid phosphatase
MNKITMNYPIHFFIILLSVLLLPMICLGQDTTKHFTIKNSIFPAACIAYGLYSIDNNGLKVVDMAVKDKFVGSRKLRFDDYTTVVPEVLSLGLKLSGVKGKNNLFDYAAISALAYGIGTAVVLPVKSAANVWRPDHTGLNSFPSGHTTVAFVSAELLRKEYGDQSVWYSIGGYTTAIITARMRIYNNRHWLSDVVAGAGIGILSTRLSYWMYPKIKKLFQNKDNNEIMMITPTSNGIGIVYQFK